MDRAEKIGLGTALGGHVVLFAALSLGLLLSTQRIEKPESLSVSLVGEISDVSTAPDAIQEEPAPAAAGDTETFDPPAAMPIVRPVPQVIERDVTPPAKTAIKQVTPKQIQPKQQTRPNTSRNPPAAKSGGFSKSFEDAVNNAGRTAGTGTKSGTVASKSAAEVRRTVNAALGPQIKPYLRGCAPSGIDVNQIETYVTLSLDRSGRLNSVSYNKQTGINDSNRAQAEPVKNCILQAVRSASPYSGLDPDYYDVWKSHPMRMRSTG